MILKAVTAIFAGICVATLAQASTPAVTWGAYESNGVGITDAGGSPLPLGDLVLLGHFNLTPAQIISNGGNEAFLMSNFVTFATGHIGDGHINDPHSNTGYWEDTSSGSTNALGIQNQAIEYWVFNATTANAATQYGIFTGAASTANFGAIAAAWRFPDDNAVANVTVTDLSNVPTDSTGIYWGSYNGTGTSSDGFSPLYYLAPFTAVPEPSTWVAGALVVATLARAARRRVRA